MNHTQVCTTCKLPGDLVAIMSDRSVLCDQCWQRLAERQMRFERSLFGRIWLWWKGTIA